MSFTVSVNEYAANIFLVDDSLFVNAFGVGTNNIVVYQDSITGNVSIRGAFNISGTGADLAIDGTTYRALFLAGVKDLC